jgi:hypothetical protein
MEKQTTKMEIGATYEKNGNKATIIGEGKTSGGWNCWFVKVEKLYERTQDNCDMGYITKEQLSGTEPYVVVESEGLIMKVKNKWDNIFNY